ncbi:MAG: hypothetical protein KGQ59_04505 [Bdellovibrionales bacterium]|nr:hypothetical protein [Bdellovibrionales bacterium]
MLVVNVIVLALAAVILEARKRGSSPEFVAVWLGLLATVLFFASKRVYRQVVTSISTPFLFLMLVPGFFLVASIFQFWRTPIPVKQSRRQFFLKGGIPAIIVFSIFPVGFQCAQLWERAPLGLKVSQWTYWAAEPCTFRVSEYLDDVLDRMIRSKYGLVSDLSSSRSLVAGWFETLEHFAKYSNKSASLDLGGAADRELEAMELGLSVVEKFDRSQARLNRFNYFSFLGPNLIGVLAIAALEQFTAARYSRFVAAALQERFQRLPTGADPARAARLKERIERAKFTKALSW